MSAARPGERHSGAYNTIDEIEFLNDMPRLMSIRAGDKEFPRKQSDVEVLTQYRQYLNASMYRQEWGEINKKKILDHCRKLMSRYTKRLDNA
tara:strand:- start:707 stop:982 length:276 start_codon:yes stop_codon:yes gene_type:complete